MCQSDCEKWEDVYDEAMAEHKQNPVTYSQDEVEKIIDDK